MKKIVLFVSYLLLLCVLTSCASDITLLPTDGEMTVTFFNVGKADFILIQSGGECAVIDTGYSTDWGNVRESLKDRDIENIKYLIATHPDKDHIGCMDRVMENFTVGQLYTSGVQVDSKQYENMMSAAAENSVPIKTAQTGDVMYVGAARIETLSPTQELVDSGDENEASVVLMLTYGKCKILLCADAQKKAEKSMMASGANLSADVIKIGHHGSNKSSSKSFLDEVGAEYAVISTGKADGEEYISDKVLNRLDERNIEVLRTDINGDINLICDGENIRFETEYE